ncbi:MAG: hypothetical protein Unbinned2990contig1001_40 [Prokaryotic dsDNA virus sp.]|nr:MAG: hypothetical protein Unbinned2990contig1001_40 [Prokaryotic dsDNA virus sp.]|tara:strand:+ start:22979 stop:23587 length:609 start_codon:yes stop_codon:yes gene_type:complete
MTIVDLKRFQGNGIRAIDGEVTFDMGDKVIGFEIDYKGKCELENYDIPNWLFQGNTKKIIGVSLDGKPIGLNPFLKYIGKFSIQNCIIVNTDMQSYQVSCYENITDHFENQIETFSSDNRYFNELDNNDNNKGIQKITKTKLNLVTKNLSTNQNIIKSSLKIDQKDYIGDFHIDNGKIKTGKEPDRKSIIINNIPNTRGGSY